MDKFLFGKVNKGFSCNYDKLSEDRKNNYCFFDDEKYTIIVESKNVDLNSIQKILKMYIKNSEEFLNILKPNYSIYLYDKEKNKTIISRDIAGAKFIYYTLNESNLYFSNDLDTLVNKSNIKKEINTKVLSLYFRYHYINPPDTIYKKVYQLKHGDYILIENGKIAIKNYYNIINEYNEKSKELINNYEECKKTLNSKLNNYIKNKVSSFNENGYKWGIYLSGGIDSSLMTALCSKHSKEPVNTFSIGFYEKDCDESEKSDLIAEYCKTNHHKLLVDEKMALDSVNEIIDYYGEPFADPSEVATIILNKYAKENNIDVVITGDGADQLFCGGGVYDTLFKVSKAKRFINPLNIQINNKFLFNNRKLNYLFGNKDYPAQCEVNYDELSIKGLFKENKDSITRFKQENEINSNNIQEKHMILDFDTFICDRVVHKMNIAAQKNGVETNSPFLTSDIIEHSFKIPHKWKYDERECIKKYILKEILYDYIPREIIDTKKHGFSIPTKAWLKTYFKDDLKRLSSKRYIQKQGIFNYDVINKLISNMDKGNRIVQNVWDFYIFQLWYDRRI